MSTNITIPVVDPKAAYQAHKAEIDEAVQRVLNSGWYILGKETSAFERDFAAFAGVEHGVGAATGTDAIELALRGAGVGRGDLVLAPSHTAVATVAAVERAGAAPILIDVDQASYCMDMGRLADTLRRLDKQGRRAKAVIPVHLYGRMADMDAVLDLAARYELKVIEDCAQAHGAALRGKPAGSFGHVSCFSFYPTKNLAALGDGGMAATADAELARRIRALREYGWTSRYISEFPGVNSRLDEVQAAVLNVRLKFLPWENERRRELAAVYDERLAGTSLALPSSPEDSWHVYHLYVVRHPRRDELRRRLAEAGVGAAVHYPQPVHTQPAYKGRVEHGEGGLEHSESACREVLSLPMHPHLSSEAVERVCEAIAAALTDMGERG